MFLTIKKCCFISQFDAVAKTWNVDFPNQQESSSMLCIKNKMSPNFSLNSKSFRDKFSEIFLLFSLILKDFFTKFTRFLLRIFNEFEDFLNRNFLLSAKGFITCRSMKHTYKALPSNGLKKKEMCEK